MDTSHVLLLQLTRAFGRWWSIWQTHDDTGAVSGWWACRRARVLSTDEMSDGLVHQVAESTGGDLRTALLDQAHLEADLLELAEV